MARASSVCDSWHCCLWLVALLWISDDDEDEGDLEDGDSEDDDDLDDDEDDSEIQVKLP